MNVIRFRRVFTRCECTPQFSGARCEICEFIIWHCKGFRLFVAHLDYLFVHSNEMLATFLFHLAACAGRPCQNGGTCSDLDGCDCTPGWTGPGCETRKPCFCFLCDFLNSSDYMYVMNLLMQTMVSVMISMWKVFEHVFTQLFHTLAKFTSAFASL